MKIAEISIKRPSIIIVLFIALILGGIYSYKNLSYELIPKFEVNVITVATVYPGASPSEIENTVTKKIEDAVASLENVKKVEAMSFESLSTVMIALTSEADVDLSLNDAQRKINAILKDLPKDVDPPSLQKYSLSDLPIMTLSVTSNSNEKELYDLLDKKIQPIFSRVNGVAKVELIGGEERQIQVLLDPKKIEAYGLNVPAVQQMILASNLDFPTGNVKSNDKQTLIRLAGKYKNVEEMRELVIASKGGIDIRLSDIADVQDGIKEIEKIARLNQKSTILMQIIKQSDANAVTISELVHQTIAEVENNNSDIDLKIHIANDTSQFTLKAANSVIFDLFLAVVLVAFVMLFFLHSFRNALIVMVAIPLSLIATFLGLYLFGYSLNLLSLLALSLVVGILVDDAIVVIENIHRHMEMGKNKVRASYDGAKEIGFTVTAITLVIVVVFLPIAMSSGLVPNIIKQFCVTVIIATMLSLLVSFTIVPWLSSRYGKIEVIKPSSFFGKILHNFEKGLSRFTHAISDLLVWSLNSTRNTIIVLIVVGITFFASIALAPMGYIGFEFFPKTDKGEFLVQLELPKDASVEQTNKVTQKVEEYLQTKPEIQDLITTVGQSSEGYGGIQGTKYKSEIQVVLVDKKQRKDNSFVYAAKLKNELAPLVVDAKIKTVPVGLIGAEEAPLSLTVTGSSLDDAMDFAIQAKDILEQIPGAMEVKLTSETGSPEINVQVDRDKMAALGLDMYTVGMTMQTAFNGNTDSKFRAGEYEYDINIRFQEYARGTIDDVKDISFMNNIGQNIKLQQFATVAYSSGPSVLERRDKTPSVTIKSQTIGRDPGQIGNEWLAQFDQLEKKAGVNYQWSGTMEDQEEGFGTLGVALLAAIIFVYLVMVALYDSFSKPFIVIFAVPLSFIGALLALAIANISLNIFTILGIIMLIGLVCKNAILLVDFANHRVEAGDSVHDALIAANHARLRPILMTTIAMVIGMVPIALASGAGSEMNNGLAVVIIGGLLSSLFLTLVIVPIIYSIFDKIGNRFGKKEKVDFAALMVKDYTVNDNFVDEFASKTDSSK
ncbi:efflux RND transporter permease subunit [Myroides phaeus]|uniref:Heavy metal efflux pump, CzcA family/hydrophobe/amphiphile efflux-1 (HAE1) family protein n=1 Tax=Myroides phaeus TaxID=702745 RepID=A0A1G8C3T4_9FLAO|nr:efflux RND transporter permease subunit [Myroides phaeus]SDH39949.1 heavy metal efflux pump, CzcA family/hydrophobe/amphiphile efflux-1 (HAE1) family protein [Myroides phaeus]